MRPRRLAVPALACLAGLPLLWMGLANAEGEPVLIRQHNRAFSTDRITVAQGTTVRFTNEDEFLHQIYTDGADFSFDSDEQPPGSEVTVTFNAPGQFDVLCGIHPRMRLRVDVEP